MSKNVDVVKEAKNEIKKTAARAQKAAAKAVSDNKAKITEVVKEVKAKSEETNAVTAETKLAKAVNNKMKLHIEYYGKQVSEDEIAKKLFEKLKEIGFKGTIKSLNIYFKAEENTAYCVVNDSEPIVLNF